MLLATADTAGAVALAMLFPEKSPQYLTEIAWGLVIVVAILALPIAFATHLKINSDHEAYGEQYVQTSQLLDFYKEVEIEGNKTRIKTEKNIGKGKGYRKTQIIIWVFATEITPLTFLFTLYSDYFLDASNARASVTAGITYTEGCGRVGAEGRKSDNGAASIFYACMNLFTLIADHTLEVFI